jgi:ferrochelatase
VPTLRRFAPIRGTRQDQGVTDGLLLVSFGGPEGPDDVIPFLENATKGRGIPRERLAEVGVHYTHFGGVSPINAQNRELLTELRSALRERGEDLPVLWGNRNWDPYLSAALAQAKEDGITRLYAFVTSAHSSYSGCRQYRENLYDALVDVVGADNIDDPGLEIVKLRAYFDHPGFVEPFIDGVVAALIDLGPEPVVRDEEQEPIGPESLPDDVALDSENVAAVGTRLVFTTHSIPLSAAENSGPPDARGAYLAQHRAVAQLITDAVNERLGTEYEWDLVYQSRSGAPHIPWLEPDISVHLADLAQRDVPAAVLIPIGFVSDHMEVVWDLDTVALADARKFGLPAVRVSTPGTDPRFVDMVLDLLDEARTGRPGQALTPLGPWPSPCAAGCCPNPRSDRPALCGRDT